MIELVQTAGGAHRQTDNKKIIWIRLAKPLKPKKCNRKECGRKVDKEHWMRVDNGDVLHIGCATVVTPIASEYTGPKFEGEFGYREYIARHENCTREECTLPEDGICGRIMSPQLYSQIVGSHKGVEAKVTRTVIRERRTRRFKPGTSVVRSRREARSYKPVHEPSSLQALIEESKAAQARLLKSLGIE